MANKSENKDLVLFPQEQSLVDQPLLFEGVYIRHEWVAEKEDWFFSAVDVCNVLADSRSKDPGAYWRKLKQRLATEGSEVVTNCHGLKLVASDGKKYLTDCFSTKDVLRLIQSIPSPKAEPFKMWLAQVGSERLDVIKITNNYKQFKSKILWRQYGTLERIHYELNEQ